MVKVSALIFVKAFEHSDSGDLNLLGAVWDRISIASNDPEDGGCQLLVVMQTDDANEPNDMLLEVTAWREDVERPTVHKTSFALDGTVTGRNRAGVVLVPSSFFREAGDYVVAAGPADEAATAYVRITVVSTDATPVPEVTLTPRAVPAMPANATIVPVDAATTVPEPAADAVEADALEADALEAGPAADATKAAEDEAADTTDTTETTESADAAATTDDVETETETVADEPKGKRSKDPHAPSKRRALLRSRG